ncbi:MAG: hypothetical protein ACKPKO_39915, partial [Candidatus Fonsibacter sp.]
MRKVRPVWVGESVNWLAREPGAYSDTYVKSDRSGSAREPGAHTRIRKVRPVWVGENVNWLAR